ncbi:MAG: glycosyltransferase family 4 protein [Gemmatimonadota bacterium]|nr:glycosyltransferase family 4 protein [Gemmatimonadota bacterium]
MNSNPRILFLARRYPPSVGGIQTYARELHTRLRRQCPVTLVALGKDPIFHLAWFMPYAFCAAVYHILRHRPGALFFMDGVTAALAPFLRPFTPARFVVTVHGAELTFRRGFFSHLMLAGARACDRTVMVSRATSTLAVRNGLPAEKTRVIYQGIQAVIPDDDDHQRLRDRFEKVHGLDLRENPVLLNYGRQVRRKGVVEFIETGVPLMRDDIRLFISGSGPVKDGIRAAVEFLNLGDRVFILGRLDDPTLAMLRREAQLFLMPNIHLPHDAEGFGIAPLECLYAGLPVVYFDVDALGESLRDGGFGVPPGDYPAFVERIHRYLDLTDEDKERERTRVRAFVRAEYSWEKTTAQYMDVFTGRD